MKNIKVSEISKQSVGKWEFILQSLGINIPENGKHGPCPKCGGKDRFRFDNKDGRGTWFCNQCGNGDGIDIVKRFFDIDTVPAAARVAECLPSAPAMTVPARKETAKKVAAVNWSALLSQSVAGESPYLVGKGLIGHISKLTTRELLAGGEKYPTGSLMLSVKNSQGAITGIQLIRGDGVKSLMKGSKYSGCFISLNDFPEEPPEKVIITEGYGTAISVSLLSDGWPLAALSKTNLKAAAEAVREKWPETQIIIAGDNDFMDGKPNEGREMAIKAALAVKGWVSIPPGRAKADWDDYRRDFGIQRAREAFAEEMFNPGDTKTRLPPGFRLTKEFLWCERTRNDGSESGQVQQIKICSPLKVTAITCDSDGGNFGRLLEWDDSNGSRHEWAMPMTVLAGAGQDLREVLLENGLHFISVNGTARGLLMEYIATCRPVRKVTCVEKTGWYGGSYVLNGEVIGGEAGSVIFQAARSSKNDFRVSGDTCEWMTHVGRYCVGNSRLVFCVSLAFAAPLLTLLGIGGGGYHLKGESTDGKTTTMKVAASVCGGPDYWKTWRATGNALEGIALRRNDAVLMLDEISEVDGREASRIAYMLGNGQGKARARVDGSPREQAQWTLLFLSTGEVSIAEHAAEAGERRTGAGVGVRMVQIPSNTGHFGAFEELHGFSGGKAFAEHLEQASRQYHGAVFRDWLRWLTANLNAVTERARALRKKYERTLIPENAGNQVGRVVDRFALLAVAGELATEAGITGWEAGEAENATRKCLDAWIQDRGHTANQEDADALEKVRRFITANQYTRFAEWTEDEKNRPANMVGFRRVIKGNNNKEPETSYYVLSSGWKEICGTSDAVKTARLCSEAGWLDTDDEKRLQRKVRLPEIGSKWVYVFKSDVVG
ncbi:DUF927 domain-containing protein [Klebsiella oxytoca]|uniref:DUF927 domain-containing protein n=1 Tax=Klebsiella michiganensis TaxID=1134687 RepID=UPI001119EB55|nr:DUF927 domain-containing protein [Klebsiella michiganensis]ELI8947553.1 DUF927 domain-containing protein [Klebsiella oxytoca]HBV2374868.1 DUF927 domain-containing protein [Klebsiella quasipneumoniae]HDT5938164.1 DUF927 domain-containing protein [Klebsiella quasipneumoniae subsp. similipneumoniae]HDY8553322.1 DUF927 domain-containing protein [Klebsiella pneumoniae]MCW9513285.1 DUF927 domain-containing protein [Klebsiella michiganensis]